MIRLKTHSKMPPGEFFIKVRYQNGTATIMHGPCSASDGCHVFGPGPDIKHVALDFGAFLNANHLPGGDFATCLQAVDKFTCERLGGGAAWCRDSDQNYAQSTASLRAAQGGGCCGAVLK